MNRDISEISKLLVETGKWGPEMVLIAERANYRCEYCHLDLLSSVEAYKLWQADHIVPKSQGGGDEMENIALACRLCNCDLKKQFNPRIVNPNAERSVLITVAREYIQKQREKAQADLDHVRRIVGWPLNED